MKWKYINIGKGYYISDMGDIKNSSGKVLLQGTDKDGYKVVGFGLGKRGKYLYRRVHRVVLEYFLYPCDMQVNHKNGIKSDNRLENLEYCTQSENIRHSYDTLGRIGKMVSGSDHPKSRKICQYTREGEFIKEYESIRSTGYNPSNISQVALGRYKTAYGYIWKYKK